ncbi:MAG TPA: PAS domain S-box protein, partial [Burkholderiaceae bacterium]|nr:PAS domain S-box protein [Burkholderiaceae bacterium]
SRVNPDTATRPGSRCAEADFQSLAETLSSLIVLIRGDKILYVNPAACALLGRPREWFLGRDFWDAVYPDDREAAIARGRARTAGIAQPKRLTERLLHADGSAVWMDFSIDVVLFEGQPTTLCTGHDVTERLRVEEELRRSEARLAEAQRIGNVGSWEWDVASGRVTWSDEMCRIFAFCPRQFGASVAGYLELVHPEDRPIAQLVMEQALERGGSFAFEHRIVRQDGVVRTIFGRGEVFRGADGKPVRVAGTGQDISEKKRIAQELQQSEERFGNLCTQAPVMLMSFDHDKRIRDVSNFWLQTTGYERHEVIGRNGFDFITPDSRERLLQAIEQNRSNNEVVLRNLPLRGVCKDGSTIDLLSTSVAEIGDGGEHKGAICVQINLTDLRRAEAALHESAERYRALVEHAPEAIMVLDVDLGRFVDANAHAERLFGWSRERLLTMGPLDFCPEQQADRRASCEVIEDEHRKVLAGGTAEFEFAHVDAAGREIIYQTRLSRLPAAGRQLIRATITDVTELKHLQEKVRHAEKLAAVGVLAAGVAHEIGNPLMALSMAAQSLERRTQDAYAQGKLKLIREHIDRISRIVWQMSDLARPPSGRRGVHDLNHIVRRAVEMVRYDRRARNAEVHYQLAEQLPGVEIVEDELTQVCINLALNAFDAMAANPPGRPRRLHIRSASADGLLRVTFADTGPGVPRELRTKLFQPFFTTKEVGLGSGLGLSVSYRILQEHRGTLALDENVTDGAAFAFELPVGLPIGLPKGGGR